MLEFKKSYDARFLGRHVLNSAVTSNLLCHLVHNLPESVQGQGAQCTVQCNAFGLTVSRVVTSSSGNTGRVSLKVPLCDILFCHVDKSRPEVTVWVVRSDDDDDEFENKKPLVRRTLVPGQRILQAYVYQCVNQTDAVDLFNVYNEVNQQAKLDKYRRSGEKKEEIVTAVIEDSGVQYKTPTFKLVGSGDDSRVGIDNDTVNKSVELDTHFVPSVTFLSPNVKEEVKKLNKAATQVPSNKSNGDVRGVSKSWHQPQHQQHVSQPKETSEYAVNCTGQVASRSNSSTWSSIVGNIANYRKSFRILRPRDKEVRAAVLQELREKLRSRSSDETENDHSLANGRKPFDNLSGGSRLPDNRQRKPAKTIPSPDKQIISKANATSANTKSAANLNFNMPPSGTQTRTSSKGSFQFPWSMGSAMKKLVSKKRNNGYMITSTFRPIPCQPPVWFVHSTEQPSLASNASFTSKNKFKSSKKGPAPAPPTRMLNQPHHLVGNGGDPYFYLPPLPMIQEANSTTNPVQHSNSGDDIVVPYHLAQWRHRNGSNIEESKRYGVKVLPVTTASFKVLGTSTNDEFKQYAYPAHRYYQGNQSNHHQPSYGYFNGITSMKKKPHVPYGLGRFSRTNVNKKRTPANISAFNRTSSTGSRGSTSSESDPDNKLRSVMKKPRQTNEISPPEQKKNVTFHAYATVQVLN